MRQKSIVLSARNIMGAVAKNIYVMAPVYKPRNGGVILEKLQEFLISTFNYTEFGGYEFPIILQEDEREYTAVENFLRKILLVIPEFEQLNITEAEYEAGIQDVNDPRREDGFCFVDRYTPATNAKDESWKQDFIDLDALLRNIANDLLSTEDSDCFCCVRTEEGASTQVCQKCIRNENLRDYFIGSRRPRGERKHSCYTDCPNNKYICCVECTKEEYRNCQYRCNEAVQPCSKAHFIDGKETEEYIKLLKSQEEEPKPKGERDDRNVQHMDCTGMPVQPKTN